jgi:hypothetical protein
MNTIIAFLLPLVLTISAQSGVQPDPWEPFRFLVGSWEGYETGKMGIGNGVRTYEFILGGQYLFCNNTSTFEPQEKNPKGEVHKDWSFFSYDKNRQKFVVREFHIEGFVNRLVLDTQTSDSRKFVFVSEASENAPPGLRARLIYEIKDADEFAETFELAMPGKDFEIYLTNYWKRTKGVP